MIRDNVPFSKTTRRVVSCNEPVNVLGINMGICLVVTVVILITAVIGCLIVLCCVNIATRREKQRYQRARLAREAARKQTEEGTVTKSTTLPSLPTTETIALADTNEMTALTSKIIMRDENDVV